MKRVISCLVTITLLLALTPLSLAEGEWFKSDDGVLEVQVVSFEEKSYPQYTLQLCFRLDGNKVSDTWAGSFSLNSVISQYTASHTEMKNRKVAIASEGKIKSFTVAAGTSYEIIFPVTVGNDKIIELSVSMDAATVFPNDFVNADAMRIAALLNDVKASFVDPESFELLEAVIADPFFAFHISGSNRMGGKSQKWYAGKFFSETGEYYAIDMDGDNNLGKLPASLSLHDKYEVTDEIIDFYFDDLNKATLLSTQAIMNYMN